MLIIHSIVSHRPPMLCDLIRLNGAILFESFTSVAVPQGASHYQKHYRNRAIEKAKKLLDEMRIAGES
jgi:hypothetical protein